MKLLCICCCIYILAFGESATVKSFLMPYPIFEEPVKNHRDFLLLGTKKAKDLVHEKNLRLNKQKKKAFSNFVQDEKPFKFAKKKFIRRQWIPKQIKNNN